MNMSDKDKIRYKTNLEYSFYKFKQGISQIKNKAFAKIVVVIYIAIIIWVGRYISDLTIQNEILKLIPYKSIIKMLYVICVIAFTPLLTMLIGTPMESKNTAENLCRINFTNYIGEPPMLISKEYDKTKNVMKLVFLSNGIPISDWYTKRDKIEAVLNIYMTDISVGKNQKEIVISAVSGNRQLPKIIEWNKNNLSDIDFELLLGKSLIGTEKIDLSKIPHVLIGGSTGSGKSMLLKLLIMQCICKGAKVYIADFKGGVDFSSVWHEKCTIVTSTKDLMTILYYITDELERRKKVLCEAECENIGKYNKTNKEFQQRIIFGCDEIAEILDKTGLTKVKKEEVAKIESQLSIIARQGRAFGIHLILSTQRPDANILAGQIKNNIDFRICGRADSVLSQIILDSTDANDKIPKSEQGLFLTNSGILFRGFLFDKCNEWGKED